MPIGSPGKSCQTSFEFGQHVLQAASALRTGSMLGVAWSPSLRLAVLLSLAAFMDITANDFRIGQLGVVYRLVH
jgi:hypothetical protein